MFDVGAKVEGHLAFLVEFYRLAVSQQDRDRFEIHASRWKYWCI